MYPASDTHRNSLCPDDKFQSCIREAQSRRALSSFHCQEVVEPRQKLQDAVTSFFPLYFIQSYRRKKKEGENERRKLGPGEMSQGSRALAALPETPFDSSTH